MGRTGQRGRDRVPTVYVSNDCRAPLTSQSFSPPLVLPPFAVMQPPEWTKGGIKGARTNKENDRRKQQPTTVTCFSVSNWRAWLLPRPTSLSLCIMANRKWFVRAASSLHLAHGLATFLLPALVPTPPTGGTAVKQRRGRLRPR